jgi:transglutaminase-like putative cysteine protease
MVGGLARGNEEHMVYRLSALAVAGAVLLDLLRLQRLLRPTESAASWEIILIAAVILGGVITWVARAYRIGRVGTIALNVGGILLAVFRIGAPDTLTFGVLPTGSTLVELNEEFSFALQLLRFGNAPVVPYVGLIVILALVFWTFGMLAVWGLSSGHPWIGSVPALMFYLQLSTIDRAPSRLPWTLAFLGLVILTIAGVAGEDRLKGTGRLRGSDGLALQRNNWAVPIVVLIALGTVAMFGTSAAANRVPESGVLEWRSRSGFGDGIYGGVSYNLYTGIVQESLLSLSDEPVFVARVSDSDLSRKDMYWRLVTLDSFDGENWYLTNRGSGTPEAGEAWEAEGHEFTGPTTTVDQVIQIRSLQMNYLPAMYAPSGVTSETEVVSQSLRVRNDASVWFDALTFEGLTYRVRSDVPRPDINVLATDDGKLSPIFATAADRAVFDGQVRTTPDVSRPEDLEDFLELPNDLDVRLLALARDETLDATGGFETALFLERFLRNTGPGGFTYSVDIEPGHSAENLADWLTDPESSNYRTGYCEQFATSLAVLARIQGIPSRVVIGFTPGDVQEDGLIVVRQRNAHSWVELWMDGQGWVRFDPTPRGAGDNPSTVDSLAGFDPTLYVPEPEPFDENVLLGPDGQPIPRPDRGVIEDPADILEANAPFVGSGDAPSGGGPPWEWIILAVGGIVLGLIPSIKWIRRRLRIRRLKSGNIAAAWDEIVDRLTDLRYDVSEWKTPAEIAATTEPSLAALAAVYGETVYGPPRPLGRRQLEIGTASFQSAESVLRHRHSRWQLVRSWLTPSSLRQNR